MEFGGISPAIIHPPPITQLSPIFVPRRISTFAPIQQCFPITTSPQLYPSSTPNSQIYDHDHRSQHLVQRLYRLQYQFFS